MLKSLIKKNPLYLPLREWRARKLAGKHHRAQKLKWLKKGKPMPPPHLIKQETLLFYAKRYGLETLVETGTYRGYMIQAIQHRFKRVYSIEIDEELYRKASRRFGLLSHITIIHGDSGRKIADVLTELKQPALFWLDGHYSGGVTSKGDIETPIVDELAYILKDNRFKHVVVIDDARLFGNAPDYPSLQQLKMLVLSLMPNADIDIESDMIRITPKDASEEGDKQ